MEFWKCALYIAQIGLLSFLLGRIIPKSWFGYDKIPFASLHCEHEGRVYEKLGIRHWQKKLPDMSRILPGSMPAKKIGKNFVRELPVMIQETCVAEITHWFLCVAGLRCLRLWPGMGGMTIVMLNILGNLPFILIQRYNRPRLVRLWKRCCGAHETAEENSMAQTQ